jgi:transposase
MPGRRYELTDFEWSIIGPLLPNKPRGKARADDRRVLNGIYWRLRTGSPWAIFLNDMALDDVLQPVRAMAQNWRLGHDI